MARTLIICPTYDHQDSLFAAIASAQAQTDQDWEMVVIGDGSPERTYRIVTSIARLDSRIRYESHEKAPRTGEPYRDPVIRDASCEFVFHLGDDDVWLPHQIDVMSRLLTTADFAVSPNVLVHRSGDFTISYAHPGGERARERMKQRAFVPIGINFAAYRKDAYLKLPEGWTTSVEPYATDMTMWGKFFEQSWLRVATTTRLCALKFYTVARGWFGPEQRLAELTPWLCRLGEPQLERRIADASTDWPHFLEIFSATDAERDRGLASALDASGLAVADPNTELRDHAVDGQRLPVVMNDRQRQELEACWRLYSGAANKPEFRAMAAFLRHMPFQARVWRAFLRAMATASSDEEIGEAAEQWRLGAPRHAGVARHVAVALRELDRPGLAEVILKRALSALPDHPRLQAELNAARAD